MSVVKNTYKSLYKALNFLGISAIVKTVDKTNIKI